MAFRQLPLRALLSARPHLSPARNPFLQPALPARAYHPSPRLSMAYKDDQDRRELKPRPNDSTKSGSDLDPSEHHDASFNPNITSPEGGKEAAQKECNGSPLEFSGANKDVSDQADEDTPDKSDKKTKSVGKGGKKSGKVAP